MGEGQGAVLTMVPKPLFTPESLRELIELGEGLFVELKGTWSYDAAVPQPISSRRLRDVVAEYVAAFANADGGTLVIGVEDDGTATGHGRSKGDVDKLVRVPERNLRSPLTCDHQLLELDGHDVLLIEVGRAPRAVMVDGNGYPYRTGGQVIREREERINALKQSYLESGFEPPIFDLPDEAWRHVVDRLAVADAHRRALLAHPGGFTNEQYRELNGVDRDEAYRQIQELVLAGVVLPAGRTGPGVAYRLAPDLLTTRSWLEQRFPAVRQHLADNGRLTNTDYRRLFGVSRNVAGSELRRLVEEGLLELRGDRRGAHYVAGPELTL